jgi:hypothetical protein
MTVRTPSGSSVKLAVPLSFEPLLGSSGTVIDARLDGRSEVVSVIEVGSLMLALDLGVGGGGSGPRHPTSSATKETIAVETSIRVMALSDDRVIAPVT